MTAMVVFGGSRCVERGQMSGHRKLCFIAPALRRPPTVTLIKLVADIFPSTSRRSFSPRLRQARVVDKVMQLLFRHLPRRRFRSLGSVGIPQNNSDDKK